MAMVASRSSRDEYSRRARYLPAMLLLAPVGIVVAAAGWQDARMVTLVVGAAVSIGVPFLLESVVRQRGLRFEVTELAGSDGRWTTTHMLWPLTPDRPESTRNAENRRLVERVTGRSLPDRVPPGRNGDDEVAAILDEAVAVVRSLTRDADRFALLGQENAEYGMWRNLRGVRGPGLVVAGWAAVASIVLIALALGDVVDASAGELVVGLIAALAVGAFWWRIPTDERVHHASRRYALALFDAARLLAHGPPASSGPTGHADPAVTSDPSTSSAPSGGPP
jgi:hypothetical protein